MVSSIYSSATWKLTAWYLTLAMIISLSFSVVLYHIATSTLAQGLTTQQQRIYREFPVFSGNPFFVRDSDVETGAQHILANLAYANLVVLVAAGFASHWLARRTLRPIEASNERQKRFVADASHELRTPMTALKMGTEVALLDVNATKDELRAALKSNLEEADRLDTLLNSLLRLSQLESQELQHEFTSISARSLAEAAIERTRQRAEAKHIAVENRVTGTIVHGDRESLVQLLVVLLDNALKYSPEHSAVTCTSTKLTDAVAITIDDRGIGIEPAALKHVFDRFYRADKARRQNENGGFGLGLSIAKQIADLHNGDITLTSTVGKGTKATITLPSEHGPAA